MKRIITLLMAIAMLTISCGATELNNNSGELLLEENNTITALAIPPSSRLNGDLDGDGEITISDVIYIFRYLAGKITLEQLQNINVTPPDPSGTQKIGGVTFPQTPYTYEILSITKIEYDKTTGSYIYFNVYFKNLSIGASMKGSSNIKYKCYDKDGYVIYDGEIYTNAMEPQETCKISRYIPKDTVKVEFTGGKIN